LGRALKWSLTLVVAGLSFVGSLWLAIEVAHRVLLGVAEANRWAAAVAFATVMSTAVGLCTAWWAGREQPRAPSSGSHPLQHDVTAGDPGATAQGVVIKAEAHDQAQMPVLGQGTQHNTFRTSGGPRP
jgi:hypothetical protein